jgi:hypothetical protein
MQQSTLTLLVVVLFQTVAMWRMPGKATAFRTTTNTAFCRRAILPACEHGFHPNSALSRNRYYSTSIINSPKKHRTVRFSTGLSLSTSATDNNKEFPDQHSSYSIILDGLNPSQVEAVTQPISAITRVIAGPGSGKVSANATAAL